MKRGFYIACAFALILFWSCVQKGDGFDKSFLENDTACFQIDGNTILDYEPLTCQISFNRTARTFRVTTDTMSDYFIVNMSELPSLEGQTISAGLKWTDNGTVRTKSALFFSVKKMDSEGNVWLWCEKEKIALVVRIF